MKTTSKIKTTSKMKTTLEINMTPKMKMTSKAKTTSKMKTTQYEDGILMKTTSNCKKKTDKKDHTRPAFTQP